MQYYAYAPRRKSGDHKPTFPDREIIAKAEGRFAKGDKQRAGIKTDSKREVAREQGRVNRVQKEKPDT